MMREYKRYDEYKDSGVEWIGEIPKEWKVSKLKYNYTFEKGTNAGDYTKTYIAENKGDYPVYSGQTENNGVMGKINHYDYKSEGCILTTTVGAKAMTSSFISGKFSLSQNCLIMRKLSESVIPEFDYYFLTRLFAFERNNIPSHMQPSLRMEDLNQYKILSPTILEQQKISSFLDQKTAEIDEIIMKKETLVEQLEKYKKSVITEAVTKGKLGNKYLNEDGELVDRIEMKDSGVDWISEIPVYFEITKATYIFNKIGSGTTPSSNNLDYYNGNIKWLMTGDLNDNYVFTTKKTITKKALRENTSLEIHPKNSLVIAMYGATIGKLGILGHEMATNQACCVLSDSTFNQSKYYYYWLLSKREALISLAQGGGQPNINQDLIRNFNMPIFNSIISRKISNYLDKKTSQIDNLIKKTKQSIEKYKEYKKSLIFEAVTGKIDLRDYELEGGEKLAEHNNSSETERECISAVD